MRLCHILFEKLDKNKGSTGCWRFKKNIENRNKDVDRLSVGVSLVGDRRGSVVEAMPYFFQKRT